MEKDKMILIGLALLVLYLLFRQSQVKNAEVWEWIDRKGNKRYFRVDRDVKGS